MNAISIWRAASRRSYLHFAASFGSFYFAWEASAAFEYLMGNGKSDFAGIVAFFVGETAMIALGLFHGILAYGFRYRLAWKRHPASGEVQLLTKEGVVTSLSEGAYGKFKPHFGLALQTGNSLMPVKIGKIGKKHFLLIED